MRVKVRVTKEHIAQGKRVNAKSCMVALALRPHLKNGYAVGQGGLYDARKKLANRIVRWSGPVYERIMEFDRGNPVEPFTFTFTIADSWVKHPATVEALPKESRKKLEG